MPTLPGGETNILASLSRFASSGSSARVEDFDWGELVASSMIGKDTERQRLQLGRFMSICDDLGTWFDRTGLPTEHLKEAAFYAVVSTEPETIRHEQALVFSQLIAWIYEIDDFMDVDAPERLRDVADQEASRCLDNALARIFTPIYPILGRRELQHLHPSATWDGRRGQPEFSREPALSRSLEDLFERLPITWEHLAPKASRGSRERQRLVVSQLVTCVRGMRHEFWWNRRLARMAMETGGRVMSGLPTVAEYENAGADSIGMCACSAWAATCGPEPHSAWRNAAQVIDRSARIIRLANDAYTYEADAATGKMSAVTLQLQAMGAPLSSQDDQRVPQARERVEGRLKTLMRSFAHASKQLPTSVQSYYLRHVVAFASAVYGGPALA